MKSLGRMADITLLIIFLFFVSLRQAHAYIDAGSGSYFFQILIASVCAGLYAVKVFWKNIVTMLSGLFVGGRHKNNDGK